MHTKDRSLKANEWSSSHTWMFSSSQKFPGHPLCSPPFPLLLQPKNPSLKKNPLTSKSPLFPCLSYQATTCSHVHHSANASSSPTTMGEPCSWPPLISRKILSDLKAFLFLSLSLSLSPSLSFSASSPT